MSRTKISPELKAASRRPLTDLELTPNSERVLLDAQIRTVGQLLSRRPIDIKRLDRGSYSGRELLLPIVNATLDAKEKEWGVPLRLKENPKEYSAPPVMWNGLGL